MAVVVTVAPNEVDAEIICGLLRSNGISCYHRKTDAAGWGGGAGLVGMGGSCEVLVSEADHDAALKLLTDETDLPA
jgi:Putative prokaryotic signal transducing protein